MMEDHIVKLFDSEISIAKSNNQDNDDALDSYVGMFENQREEKDYDWMSDISIPEFSSQLLTQSSLDVNTYFSTRDFAEVYLQDDSDEAINKANAAKELINRTLNQKKLYHYPKFVRSKLLNHLGGRTWAVCRWIKRKRPGIVGYQTKLTPTGKDINGSELVNENQIPSYTERTEAIEGQITVEDRFDYDIIHPANVFTDNSYTYSAQEKEWIYIRSERSLQDLKKEEEQMGYENLDELGMNDNETETSKDTYNRRDPKEKVINDNNPKFDIYDRYGLFWVSEDKEGRVKSGLDADGNPKEDAEFTETIITFAVNGSTKKMIRFDRNRFKDYDGNPYKPIIRGLCYVHPTNDAGIGDGPMVSELQVAINDTFNISNDRVRLATIPVLKATKNSVEDNTSLYIEPGHVIEEYEKDDVRELQITDNIGGALNQMSMLMQKMQQATAINPPAMGQLPALSSTTATAIAGAEQHTNMRNGYKEMTYEYTFLAELYCMIQLMTYQFADAETAHKLMGEKMYDFDPSKAAEFYYKPVSQSIEAESSKAAKRKELLQMFQIAAQTGQSKKANYIYGKYMEYLGDEFVNFKNHMDEVAQTGNQAAVEGQPASNQYGNPQSLLEQGARA